MKTTNFFKLNIPQNISNLNWKQSRARFPNMRPLGDADGDRLKNKFDCKPFDRMRQGEGHNMTNDDYGFKMVYKKPKKKVPTAEELVDEFGIIDYK